MPHDSFMEPSITAPKGFEVEEFGNGMVRLVSSDPVIVARFIALAVMMLAAASDYYQSQ